VPFASATGDKGGAEDGKALGRSIKRVAAVPQLKKARRKDRDPSMLPARPSKRSALLLPTFLFSTFPLPASASPANYSLLLRFRSMVGTPEIGIPVHTYVECGVLNYVTLRGRLPRSSSTSKALEREENVEWGALANAMPKCGVRSPCEDVDSHCIEALALRRQPGAGAGAGTLCMRMARVHAFVSRKRAPL